MSIQSTIPSSAQPSEANWADKASVGELAVKDDSFTQKIQLMQGQLNQLSQNICSSIQLQPELLPQAFKDLGIVLEKLQLAQDQLQQQQVQLEEAQRSLATDRQRYQELFELSNDAYVVTSITGVIQQANRTAAGLLNVSEEFLIGRPFFLFIAQEERKSCYAHLVHIQEAKQTKQWLVSLCPHQGQPCLVSIVAAVVRDFEGKVVGLRLCIRKDNNAPTLAQQETDNDVTTVFPKQVYLKGETIPLNPQSIWLVRQGVVKLTTISETGEQVLLGLAGPSMPFGSALTALEVYQATALSEVELMCMPLKDVIANGSLAQKVLPHLNARLQQTEAMLAILGQRRVIDRLHYLLRFLERQFGQSVPQGNRLSIRLTHQDLAAVCSTTRVTITRMLGKLQEEGKIYIDYKNHIILLADKDL